MMKKFLAMVLAAVLALSLVACGEKDPAGQGGGDASYDSAVQVLETIYGGLGEDQQFPIGGGDAENTVMDAPGAFDVAKTEELDVMLGLPASQAAAVTEAASMLHMMNANTFTSAAYKLADGTDLTAFADAVKENVLARQWMCGMPDTRLIVNVGGGYVVTAFGADELIQAVKTAALGALTGSEVIAEEAIG